MTILTATDTEKKEINSFFYTETGYFYHNYIAEVYPGRLDKNHCVIVLKGIFKGFTPKLEYGAEMKCDNCQSIPRSFTQIAEMNKLDFKLSVNKQVVCI